MFKDRIGSTLRTVLHFGTTRTSPAEGAVSSLKKEMEKLSQMSSGQELLGSKERKQEMQINSPKTARARILDEAMEITHKDRNATYGSPEDNFQQIADLWNAYLKAVRVNTNNATYGGHIPLKPADVAVMNMLIKVARLAKTPSHHDSAVDVAGYAACLGEIQEKLQNMAVPQEAAPVILRNQFKPMDSQFKPMESPVSAAAGGLSNANYPEAVPGREHY